jgi:hypothetical protein
MYLDDSFSLSLSLSLFQKSLFKSQINQIACFHMPMILP